IPEQPAEEAFGVELGGVAAGLVEAIDDHGEDPFLNATCATTRTTCARAAIGRGRSLVNLRVLPPAVVIMTRRPTSRRGYAAHACRLPTSAAAATGPRLRHHALEPRRRRGAGPV